MRDFVFSFHIESAEIFNSEIMISLSSNLSVTVRLISIGYSKLYFVFLFDPLSYLIVLSYFAHFVVLKSYVLILLIVAILR